MMAFLALIPSWLRIALLGTGTGLACFMIGEWRGKQVATAEAEARAAQATIEHLQERGLINESVRNLSSCALARELNPNVLCDDR